MGEALQATLREIATRPWAFVAEVVQAVLLLGVIAWAARGPVARRLAARRERVAAALASAARDEGEAASMHAQAGAVVRDAEAEAPRIVAAARAAAEAQRKTSDAAAEADVARLLDEARRSVDAERTKVLRDSSERLVRLTTDVARRYLDEMLTERERRALTERAIRESLGELERGAAARRGSG